MASKASAESIFDGKQQVTIVIEYNLMRDESYRPENMVIMIQLRFQPKKVDVRSMFSIMAIKVLACGSSFLDGDVEF